MSIPLRLRVQPRIPARVIGETPLKTDLTSNRLTISLDVSDLVPLGGPVSPALLSLLFDETDGTWKIAAIGDFFNIAGALPVPVLADARKALIATAAGVYGWNAILRSDISDAGAFGKTLLGSADQAAAQSSLNLPTLLGAKANTSHTHTTGDISGLGALALKSKVDIADHSNFSAGSKLVGAGAAGVTPAEISLGANLAMTANVINTTGVALAGAFGQAVAGATFTGSTGAILASTGITSVVRTAAGRYTVTLAATQPDTNYMVIGGSGNSTVSRETFGPYNQTTTTFQLLTDNGAADTDFTKSWFLVFRPT